MTRNAGVLSAASRGKKCLLNEHAAIAKKYNRQSANLDKTKRGQLNCAGGSGTIQQADVLRHAGRPYSRGGELAHNVFTPKGLDIKAQGRERSERTLGRRAPEFRRP